MKLNQVKPTYAVAILTCVYLAITIICFNHVYFWDNLQQISKEAHWFYDTNFNHLLMPPYGSGSAYYATGYHPPLIGILTALLWKSLGYHLWVSHILVFICFFILLRNLQELLRAIFPEKYIGWILLILLMESTLLGQFAVTSPDFILFVAFVTSLRAIIQKKQLLLSIALFFLFGISMRGVFTGVLLLIAHTYHFGYRLNNRKLSLSILSKIGLPYLPILFTLTTYYTYYLISRGWFFTNSPYKEDYILPTGMKVLIVHLCAFVLRLAENGRIFIWIIAMWISIRFIKSKKKLPNNFQFIGILFLFLFGLYFLFVFISQMPFASRYFTPLFFLLTLLSIHGVMSFYSERTLIHFFIVALLGFISGHLWIYPERIAKSWDGTLAHLPYYELRDKCFNYIDYKKINYKKISGSLWIYGYKRFAELGHDNRMIGSEPSNKYFIYSNVSNADDSLLENLHNKAIWRPIKNFSEWPVTITIYENLKYKEVK
jgi:hypothetical protein